MIHKKTEIERRKWLRLPLAIPIFVRGNDENRAEFLEFGSVLNISASGSLIALAHPLRLCAKVVLEIPSSPLASVAAPSSAPQRFDAKAVRVTHADGYHLIALQFINPLLLKANGPARRRRKLASSL